ncbi:MAG: 5-(carboxyamino)imidazole ribonucleotide synthase [Weeksellaceae bacterium]|nr:5-(carboxyamino)imidazole ribonucleotide synthase [Weeksellaceae bacterium]
MKIAILGGGQLGKMFLQNAHNYPVECGVLDPDPQAPSRSLAHYFQQGDFRDYDTVMQFAAGYDIVTIEIEQVNLQALYELESQGKTVIPPPQILEIIQNKHTQKQFYLDNNIPTAPLVAQDHYPQVQKLHTGGYDGRGVQLLTADTQEKQWAEPSIYEQVADISLELSVIVVRTQAGESRTFPVVEQVFDPVYNQLDYLISPARITPAIEEQARQIALDTVQQMGGVGIYAVELFLTHQGKIWVNEIAPRAHNSGHATIEGNHSSQYDMLLRVLLDLPLADTHPRSITAMLNVVGSESQQGPARFAGMQQILAIPGTHLHWYGKSITKPGRKMGHITICGSTHQEVQEQVERIRPHAQVTAFNG